jgi:hypothetical protein
VGYQADRRDRCRGTGNDGELKHPPSTHSPHLYRSFPETLLEKLNVVSICKHSYLFYRQHTLATRSTIIMQFRRAPSAASRRCWRALAIIRIVLLYICMLALAALTLYLFYQVVSFGTRALLVLLASSATTFVHSAQDYATLRQQHWRAAFLRRVDNLRPRL